MSKPGRALDLRLTVAGLMVGIIAGMSEIGGSALLAPKGARLSARLGEVVLRPAVIGVLGFAGYELR